MAMQKELLEILACPRCRGGLEALDSLSSHVPEGLCCRVCAVVYPIREGIPVMLVEEALSLDERRPGASPVWEARADK